MERVSMRQDCLKGKQPVYSQKWAHIESDIGWGPCEDGPLFLCFEYIVSDNL